MKKLITLSLIISFFVGVTLMAHSKKDVNKEKRQTRNVSQDISMSPLNWNNTVSPVFLVYTVISESKELNRRKEFKNEQKRPLNNA